MQYIQLQYQDIICAKYYNIKTVVKIKKIAKNHRKIMVRTN